MRFFRPRYVSDGKRRQVKDWSVKIQHAGQGEKFPLDTPNEAAAAAKAKNIYLCLLGKGWGAARTQFKKKRFATGNVVTLGQFIDSARPKFSGRPKTFDDYARAFRTDPEIGKPYIEHEPNDALMCLLLKRCFPTNYKEQRKDVQVTSNVNNIKKRLWHKIDIDVATHLWEF